MAKLYLKPEELVKHSAHHRHYMGDGNISGDAEGKRQPLKVVEFWGGVAHDVPENYARQAKDEGIADTKRPSFKGE